MRIKLTIIAIITAILIAPYSFADNAKTTTSQGYVDTQIATKQNKVPAVDTNTVITTTNTTGEIDEKSIYDASGNYAEQADALVTAADANAAVQNAIDTEFVCIEWAPNTEHAPENCYIWKIRNVSSQRVLPIGYTALEYIESTGTQYIDTEIQKTSNNFKVEVDVSFADSSSRCLIGTASESPNYGGRSSDGKFELSYSYRTVMSSGVNERVKLEFYGPGNGRTYLTVTKNGVSETLSSKGGSSATTTRTFKIFANASTNGTVNNILKGNIYYAKLFIEDDMKRNLIPARRDSDGELGMYDLVSNQFFTNRGSGTFTAGPVLNVYMPTGN